MKRATKSPNVVGERNPLFFSPIILSLPILYAKSFARFGVRQGFGTQEGCS